MEGLTVIHYNHGFGHKPKHNPGGGNGGRDTGSRVFVFLDNGPAWKNAEPYIVDPTNGRS